MDPIETINITKDSTFAMMLEAQRRNHQIYYITADQMFCKRGKAYAYAQPITVADNLDQWFETKPVQMIDLGQMDCILMRKDPPFDMEYIMDTYMLDLAEQQGALVVNKPQALRDANEKFFTEHFAELTPENIISRNSSYLRKVIKTMPQAIVKPMDGMGGSSIFKTGKDDPNLNVILETVTQNNRKTAMVQNYLTEIDQGDKRILIIDGQTVPYGLARIPSTDDFRGNLAKGGHGEGFQLNATEMAIGNAIAPKLKAMGIIFAGIDVIGDKLTEINVTSPTCIREIDKTFDLNIAAQLFDSIEQRCS